MYEPGGRLAARSAIVAQSVSSQSKPWTARGGWGAAEEAGSGRSGGAPSGSKQLRVPR